MADGAAGLRIAQAYTDDNGHFKRLKPDQAKLNNYNYLKTQKNKSFYLNPLKNEKENFPE